ncbi:MAG: ORF6N domain-containing protein [Bacteroidales bacterium]|jgi:hypothetical protein|nr:ORF6N domain-containing protein [Bacteroidales bacterium]MCI1785833.1 ORF6N domain-containing protein [Bacteroidales bacterium]
MNNELNNTTQSNIENCIFYIRNQQVMIDRDLAGMYGVETKVLNQAVKRNIERFPNKFRFQLTNNEYNELVTNCDRFESLKYASTNPYAFTEQGISMLSAVLRSQTAIQVSIRIMDAFVEMRKFIIGNAAIFQRLGKVEQKQIEADQKFDQLFKALEDKNIKPSQGIFFDGQIFDAYTFTSDLIRSAKQSLILIDNFIDDTVLTLFTKRNANVSFDIFTKDISRQLQLDIKKHNQQYAPVTVHRFNKAHDRFLIIDRQEVYHFGASLKDLGKKWFAFSKMDKTSVESLLNSITKML